MGEFEETYSSVPTALPKWHLDELQKHKKLPNVLIPSPDLPDKIVEMHKAQLEGQPKVMMSLDAHSFPLLQSIHYSETDFL